MVDDYDNKIFNYLISRVSSRENASIAVVTLTSSASLIFLAFFQNTEFDFYWESFSIGIIFPALAFLYNEITNRGLHQDDQNAINCLIKKIDKEKWEKETKKIIVNENRRYSRRILMRFAFLSPILGWLFTLPIHFNVDLTCKIILDVLFVIIIFLISLLSANVAKTKD